MVKHQKHSGGPSTDGSSFSHWNPVLRFPHLTNAVLCLLASSRSFLLSNYYEFLPGQEFFSQTNLRLIKKKNNQTNNVWRSDVRPLQAHPALWFLFHIDHDSLVELHVLDFGQRRGDSPIWAIRRISYEFHGVNLELSSLSRIWRKNHPNRPCKLGISDIYIYFWQIIDYFRDRKSIQGHSAWPFM